MTASTPKIVLDLPLTIPVKTDSATSHTDYVVHYHLTVEVNGVPTVIAVYTQEPTEYEWCSEYEAWVNGIMTAAAIAGITVVNLY